MPKIMRLPQLIVFLWVLSALIPGYAFAEPNPADVCPGKKELVFIDFINQIRQNPLQMAKDLGLDEQELLDSRPELYFMMQQDLAELEVEPRLCQAAGNHCQDMLQNGYYSRRGLNDSTPWERAEQEGYDPVLYREELGLIGFNNYLDSEKAAALLASRSFADQLQHAEYSELSILNPYITQIGAGLRGGSFPVDGSKKNVYISALDYGLDVCRNMEYVLARNINSVRIDPQKAASYFDPSANEQASEPIIDKGQSLNPLAYDFQLAAHVRSWLKDENEVDELGKVRKHEDDAGQVLVLTDDQVRYYLKTVTIKATAGDNWDQIVDRALSELLQNEKDFGHDEAGFIFHPQVTHGAIGAFCSDSEEGQTVRFGVVFVRDDQRPQYIMGRVQSPDSTRPEQQDTSVEKQKIYLSSLDSSTLLGFTLSGPGGLYQLKVPERTHPFSYYTLRLVNEEGLEVYQDTVFIQRGNQRRDIVLADNEEVTK